MNIKSFFSEILFKQSISSEAGFLLYKHPFPCRIDGAIIYLELIYIFCFDEKNKHFLLRK